MDSTVVTAATADDDTTNEDIGCNYGACLYDKKKNCVAMARVMMCKHIVSTCMHAYIQLLQWVFYSYIHDL